MRLLTILVVVLALGWTGYWFAGAHALETALRGALADDPATGPRIEVAGLNVTGFPNRFDTMIEAPQVHFPSTGVTWSAPFLQVFALSYRPTQLIAAFADTQELTGPFGAATIDSETARASATLESTTNLALDHANLVIEGLVVTSGGRALTVDRLLAATRIPEGAEDGRVQNIGITIDDVLLPETLANQLGGARRIDGATLDAVVTLDRPLDRAVTEAGAPGIEEIRIDTLDIDWGEVGLDAEGLLTVGADGYLIGDVTVAIENWKTALDLAVGAGLITGDQAVQARLGLSLLAGLSGSESRIEVPLSFREARVYLGPVPLGQAPRL